jgi:hypothetical protein
VIDFVFQLQLQLLLYTTEFWKTIFILKIVIFSANYWENLKQCEWIWVTFLKQDPTASFWLLFRHRLGFTNTSSARNEPIYQTNYSRHVHLEFTANRKIKLEGPPEEFEKAQQHLEKIARDLVSQMTYNKLTIDPKYHPHILSANKGLMVSSSSLNLYS